MERVAIGLEDRLYELHRPLGIAALEDKITQTAVVKVLHQIDEEDYRGFSYGFRPERSPHQALDARYVGIREKKVNWILDMDLKGFFDNIDKDHLMELVGLRIADTRVLRLIRKWLNAGIIEEGAWSETEKGTSERSGYGFRSTGWSLLRKHSKSRCTGTSKVRTVCGSAASTGLCGEQSVTAVPTATALDAEHAVIFTRAAYRDPGADSRCGAIAVRFPGS